MLITILALLATPPGTVLTITAGASYTDAQGVDREAIPSVSYLVVRNPAITNTVLVETRPDKLLAGVRIKWVDRSLKPLIATYEGIVTNDNRILLDSGLFVSVGRIRQDAHGLDDYESVVQQLRSQR